MKVNTINFAIPAKELKEATDALELVYTKLSPYLISDISLKDLDGYIRLGESRVSFVHAILECAAQNPDVVPRYASIEDALADKVYYDSLKEICTRMDHLLRLINLNRDLAGIELLDFSSDVYHTIKRLSDSGDPVIRAMYEMVSMRYQSKRKKNKLPEA